MIRVMMATMETEMLMIAMMIVAVVNMTMIRAPMTLMTVTVGSVGSGDTAGCCNLNMNHTYTGSYGRCLLTSFGEVIIF